MLQFLFCQCTTLLSKKRSLGDLHLFEKELSEFILREMYRNGQLTKEGLTRVTKVLLHYS